MGSKVKSAKMKVKPGEDGGESHPVSADETSTKKDGKGRGSTHRTSKLGRKGDPRMHRAVAARLANPDMTLLQALRAGGFEFPDCDEKGGNLDRSMVDADNVQLCQRKNQLSRRLRLARQAKASKSYCESGKKGENYEDDDDDELSPEAQDRLRLLIQQMQQRGKNKKRKDGTAGDSRSYKRMLSISAEDQVEVVEEDPYEEEVGGDSTARRAKNHPLFQQRQPTIPVTAWGAAAQLGLAGMAANAASAAATAHAAGQTTAAQQLQQAAAAYGAASSNTTAGAALAMAQARGGSVPAAAQHSFSFWPSLAVGGVAAAQRIIQQQQVQIQAQAQAQAQQQQQQAKSQQKKAGNEGGPSRASGEKSASDGATAPSPSLGLTAASLGMSQDQLAAVLGGGGLAAGMQSLQQQQQQQQKPASEQQKQQTQVTSPGAATGSSAIGASVGASAGGGQSDNLSTCSSLSARDQVATALRQAANSTSAGKAQLDKSGKMSMALDMLRTESASLLKRCMLMAGFEPSQTEECDRLYLEFAERAAEEEKQRIARIRARVGDTKGGEVDKVESGNHAKNRCSDTSDGKHQSGAGVCAHSHSDNPDKCFDGRHVHRLEGKCGHQAVIHQPENGQPHVDFVVDNKIECYGGMQGIKHEASSQALWPSKFSCDQLMCDSRSDSNHGVTCGIAACNKECGEVTKKIEPKVLDISDIDIDGKEWKWDSAGDDTLIGLMSLGDKTPV